MLDENVSESLVDSQDTRAGNGSSQLITREDIVPDTLITNDADVSSL